MTVEIDQAEVADALGLGGHEHVALVGGGSKTTLMHQIAAGLSGRIVLTTTARMAVEDDSGLPILLSPTDSELAGAFAGSDRIVVWSNRLGDGARGVTSTRCDGLFDRVDHLLVEVDDARRRPFMAPGPFDLVVPPSVTVMVMVIGADALGRVIADQCDRPLRVAALAQCSAYVRLSPAAAASVLLHERGPRRELGDHTRLVIAVTNVDVSNRSAVGQLLAELESRAPDVPVVAVAHDAGGAS